MATNGNKQVVASDFQSFIDESRDRKKNEALAAKIFGKDRRSSTPANAPKGPRGSLASRSGVTKRTAQPRASTGNLHGEWAYDLQGNSQSGGSGRNSPMPGSLASRISNPNAGPASNPRQKRRAAQVAEALIRTELLPASAKKSLGTISSESQAGSGGSFNRGLTIRGLAGPFAVMAQNFAPGTTAADIESAMTPIGGIISTCRILKTHPIIIAEIVFESKEGAENVIATFNNQTADGRVLSVYPKAGNATIAQPTAQAALAPPTGPRLPPTGPRAQRSNMDLQRANDHVIDGTMGFAEPMEVDDVIFPNGNGRQPPKGPKNTNNGTNNGNGLYSDGLVRGGGSNRAGGRGRGRGGRR